MSCQALTFSLAADAAPVLTSFCRVYDFEAIPVNAITDDQGDAITDDQGDAITTG